MKKANISFALLVLLPTLAFAQQRVLEKAEPPPPPPMPVEGQETRGSVVDEPQVTIRKEKDRTVAEYRMNGRLYMMKITQANGLTFWLIDERGDGQFTRRDSLDTGLRVPMWVIKSW